MAAKVTKATSAKARNKSRPATAGATTAAPAGRPRYAIAGIHPEVRAALADLAAMIREMRPTMVSAATDEADAFCRRADAINATKRDR